jgi:hypothetical protein
MSRALAMAHACPYCFMKVTVSFFFTSVNFTDYSAAGLDGGGR